MVQNEVSRPSLCENPFVSPSDGEAQPIGEESKGLVAKEASLHDPAVEEHKEKPENGNKRKMHPLAKGLVLLATAPLVMVGGALFSVGWVMNGAGLVLVGAGDLVAGGPLRAKAFRHWKEQRRAQRATELPGQKL